MMPACRPASVQNQLQHLPFGAAAAKHHRAEPVRRSRAAFRTGARLPLFGGEPQLRPDLGCAATLDRYLSQPAPGCSRHADDLSRPERPEEAIRRDRIPGDEALMQAALSRDRLAVGGPVAARLAPDFPRGSEFRGADRPALHGLPCRRLWTATHTVRTGVQDRRLHANRRRRDRGARCRWPP